MANPTRAYVAYKSATDELWSFTVLVCYGMPALRKNLAQVAASAPGYEAIVADFFKWDHSTKSGLDARIAVYEQHLASATWLATFSFFEAYISGVADEFLENNGGIEKYSKFVESQNLAAMAAKTTNEIAWRRKLRPPFDAKKGGRYQKFAHLLATHRHRFPSDLLSSLGLRALADRAEKLKASQIPDFLEHVFLLKLSAGDRKMFHNARETRNAIAHGESPKSDLLSTTKMRNALQALALRIDAHIVENFLVLDRYR